MAIKYELGFAGEFKNWDSIRNLITKHYVRFQSTEEANVKSSPNHSDGHAKGCAKDSPGKPIADGDDS